MRLRVVAKLGVLVCLAVIMSACGDETKQEETWGGEASCDNLPCSSFTADDTLAIGYSSYADETTAVIRTVETLELWIDRLGIENLSVNDVNFNTDMILIVTGVEMSQVNPASLSGVWLREYVAELEIGGYTLYDYNTIMDVAVYEAIAEGECVGEATVNPYHLVLVPRFEGTVQFSSITIINTDNCIEID